MAEISIDQKKCCRCKKTLPVDQFDFKDKERTKRKAACKTCVSVSAKRRRDWLKATFSPARKPQTNRCYRCKVEKPASEFYDAPSQVKGIDSICKPCKNRETAERSANNPESRARRNATAKRHRSKPEIKAKRSKAAKQYRQTPHRQASLRQARFKAHLKSYGLTVDQHAAMLESQNGVCAICGLPQIPRGRKRRLHIDHDHGTGKVRGLLCDRCNAGIGCFRDSSTTLRRAVEYLNPSN